VAEINDGGTINSDGSFSAIEAGKNWYQSKTIWINIAGFVVLMGSAFGLDNKVAVEIEAVVLAIVNIIVRLYTGEPLK
jgi:hypothetical protein